MHMIFLPFCKVIYLLHPDSNPIARYLFGSEHEFLFLSNKIISVRFRKSGSYVSTTLRVYLPIEFVGVFSLLTLPVMLVIKGW